MSTINKKAYNMGICCTTPPKSKHDSSRKSNSLPGLRASNQQQRRTKLHPVLQLPRTNEKWSIGYASSRWGVHPYSQ